MSLPAAKRVSVRVLNRLARDAHCLHLSSDFPSRHGVSKLEDLG